jgi:hypothetical protein
VADRPFDVHASMSHTPAVHKKPQVQSIPIEIENSSFLKIQRWHEFDDHKDDMKAIGFAMGPDFKKGYTSYEVVEAVDFYQVND